MNAILEFKHSLLFIFFSLTRFKLAYSRWESYLKRFSLWTFNINSYYQNNADIVAMEHIWIHVHGYFLAMRLCECIGVFVDEILISHRKRVLDVVDRVLTAVGHKIDRIQNHLCLLEMQSKLASKSVWNVCERESILLMLPTRTKYESISIENDLWQVGCACVIHIHAPEF